MRCDAAQRELSARMDGARNPRLDRSLDQHVATCVECRGFETRSLELRKIARLEVAAPVPDIAPAIMRAVETEPLPKRTQSRVALIALAGAAAVAIALLTIPLVRQPPAQRTEAVELLRTRTLLAWVPVRVPEAFRDDVAQMDAVAGVTEVRSGVVWLDAWTDSSGSRHLPPRGLRIPIEVAAIDTSTYERFVPSDDAGTLAALDRGGVVLGDGGAALRRIDGTGSLTLDGRTLDVAGLIDDDLIGSHEAIVSTHTGQALDIDRVRYVLIALEDDATTVDVVRRVRALATERDPVRVRVLGETPRFRHGDAVLPPVRLKETFGEFAAADQGDGTLRIDPAWMKANIVTADVPMIGSVRCHREVLPQLRAAMDDIRRSGLDDLIDRDDYGGCFVPRYLSQDEDAGISHHSWGIAFDVNVTKNRFGDTPQLDPRIVVVLERWGFTWGGRWLIPDGMHFEYLQRPAD